MLIFLIDYYLRVDQADVPIRVFRKVTECKAQ